MDKKEGETSKVTQAATQPPSSGTAKRGRPNGAELIKAKRRLDDVLLELQGFPQLRTEAMTLRDRVLEAFVEQERKNIGG